jgi:hypothetical protein
MNALASWSAARQRRFSAGTLNRYDARIDRRVAGPTQAPAAPIRFCVKKARTVERLGEQERT